MYGCESWTIKKAERRRVNAFELWYWRRLLRVRQTAKRSNQSILGEISPGFSWEIDGETVADFLFFWVPKSLQIVIAAMELKDAYSLEGKL